MMKTNGTNFKHPGSVVISRVPNIIFPTLRPEPFFHFINKCDNDTIESDKCELRRKR